MSIDSPQVVMRIDVLCLFQVSATILEGFTGIAVRRKFLTPVLEEVIDPGKWCRTLLKVHIATMRINQPKYKSLAQIPRPSPRDAHFDILHLHEVQCNISCLSVTCQHYFFSMYSI